MSGISKRAMRRTSTTGRKATVHKPPMEVYEVKLKGGGEVYYSVYVFKESEGCPICGRPLRIHLHYRGMEHAPFTVYQLCDGLAGRIVEGK